MSESKLTYSDLTNIISRFSNSMRRLENFGDYPENIENKKILRKLTDM